jgi:hypothetical protein
MCGDQSEELFVLSARIVVKLNRLLSHSSAGLNLRRSENPRNRGKNRSYLESLKGCLQLLLTDLELPRMVGLLEEPFDLSNSHFRFKKSVYSLECPVRHKNGRSFYRGAVDSLRELGNVVQRSGRKSPLLLVGRIELDYYAQDLMNLLNQKEESLSVGSDVLRRMLRVDFRRE